MHSRPFQRHFTGELQGGFRDVSGSSQVFWVLHRLSGQLQGDIRQFQKHFNAFKWVLDRHRLSGEFQGGIRHVSEHFKASSRAFQMNFTGDLQDDSEAFQGFRGTSHAFRRAPGLSRRFKGIL